MKATGQFAVVCVTLIVASLAPPASAQVAYDGPIIDRLNKWDTCPSHLFYGGKHHIWWCSRATVQGCMSNLPDGIFHVVKTGSLGAGGWTGWQEVFNKNNSPWSCNRTCDPSVIRGTFVYNNTIYTHAMFWTADTNINSGGHGVDNKVGVAFSNDGLAWVAYPSPVLQTYNTPNGTYGAGASGVAFDPVSGALAQVYDDTTMSPKSRMKVSTNAIAFTPTPPYQTTLNAYAPGGSLAPDIAFNSQNSLWYAVVQASNYEVRVLRAQNAFELLGSWTQIGAFNSSVTGNACNNNPGLGKNAGGTLYVDGQGWAYVFFGTGTTTATTWKIGQGRFRP